MPALENLNPNRVFYYFEKISSIPHGSGDMDAIAKFCTDFAIEHNLKFIRDDANNVIIYKNGTVGYENSAPIILQGHLDMVCQKTPESTIDFLKDGLDLYVDDGFIKAYGTTLGADNGIAVAMVLSILESQDIPHPPIEAVFTTDEETGMIGARALDMSVLNGKRMINLDSETEDIVTVSCAGGSDFKVNIPIKSVAKQGTLVTLEIKGLQGGHSGVEINKNRVNSNIIAGRILNELNTHIPFDIVSINGGDKANAIPNRCVIELCVGNAEGFAILAQKNFDTIKQEIADREPNFAPEILVGDAGEYSVLDTKIKNKIIYTLLCASNGVVEMSASIEGLVQTSLNLGVLMTTKESIIIHFALRSNKKSALIFLEQRLASFFDNLDLTYKTFGHYPPWEYNAKSALREIYCGTFFEVFGTQPRVKAIHAGLECGVFASQIDNFDCISIGPAMHDVHTTQERLSISSTQKMYELIIKILEKLK
ncbi:MAG: aminoacyl-histidine dipeptidase [Clostridia bacterium]|nr:aminoacyl-histidine dipeptidase [Clostridia bacterium]